MNEKERGKHACLQAKKKSRVIDAVCVRNLKICLVLETKLCDEILLDTSFQSSCDEVNNKKTQNLMVKLQFLSVVFSYIRIYISYISRLALTTRAINCDKSKTFLFLLLCNCLIYSFSTQLLSKLQQCYNLASRR